jgi:hypothetical protein
MDERSKKKTSISHGLEFIECIEGDNAWFIGIRMEWVTDETNKLDIWLAGSDIRILVDCFGKEGQTHCGVECQFTSKGWEDSSDVARFVDSAGAEETCTEKVLRFEAFAE